ncbi:hypothetical protein F4677DRAFT_442714 [Hypoxylon crocopeplum]|nr:hypothetical protein F4677DRAFT_442714 [Hypoxylon crocopeplum]
MASAELGMTFWYFKPMDQWEKVKPYFIHAPTSTPIPGYEPTNEVSIPVDHVSVKDMRHSPELFNLDVTGFTVLSHDLSQAQDEAFWAERYHSSKYQEELEQLLVKSLGAESVTLLSSSLRKRDKDFPRYTWGSSGGNQPIQGVHIDVTPKYAHQRREMTLGKLEADRIADRRFQILNVWHPLFGPIRDWPLGLVDSRSLNAKTDLIPSDSIYPHYIAETFNVFHSDSHQWYYLSDQMPDEILLFKSFDSKPGVAKCCPHASFDLGIEDQRPRESVDTLVLVVYPD